MPDESITESKTDVTDLRARARTAMRTTKTSLRELGLRLGLQHQALSRWTMGTEFDAERVLVEPKIRAWLEQLEEERAAAHPRDADSPFLTTPTSERILSALAYTKAQGDLSIIYGAPGVGKTRSILHFVASYQHVWHATIRPSCASTLGTLQEIGRAIGLHVIGLGARELSQHIIEHVRNVQGLIVLDEMQHLHLKAIEEVRAIHDESGVGIALSGNDAGYGKLTGGVRSMQFAQIFSRIGLRLHVGPPDARDVQVITEHFGLKDGNAIDLLVRVGSRPGGLRSVTKILRLASLAGTRTPTWETVRSAAANLGAEA